MRSFLPVFLFFPLILFAEPKVGSVSKIDQNIITASVANAIVGESAIVLFDYLEGSIITKSCVVIRSDETSADLKCERFSQFDQDSMPKADIAVKAGDKVIVAPLSNYAVVIAPSASRYVKVVEQNKNIKFIHPDIFALELRKAKNPHPKIKDFQKFCDRELVGNIIFALDDGDYMVDCRSFVLIRSDRGTSAKENEIMKPFYHRLLPIKKGFFAWLTKKEIKEFNSYYKPFIKESLDVK